MSTGKVDMKLEVVVIPVSDVGRAADFYESVGWRKDADKQDGDNRLLQFTPPGSPTSIIFGTGVTSAAPGSAQFLHLVVSDIEAARDELVANGVDPSEIYHDATGGYNRFDPAVRASGPGPATPHVRVVRPVQRPGREQLGPARDHDTVPGSDRRRGDDVRVDGRPRGRDATRVGRPR